MDIIFEKAKQLTLPALILSGTIYFLLSYQDKINGIQATIILSTSIISSLLVSYFMYKIKIIKEKEKLLIEEKNLFERKTKSALNRYKESALNHSIFSELSNYLMQIRVMNFGDITKEKDACIKDYLIIKFTEIKKLASIIANRECDIICKGGCNFVQDNIQSAIKNMNDEARKIGIPEVFITKFMEFHQPHIDIYWKITNNICHSMEEKYCVEKAPSHLYNLEYICGLTIEDAKKTLGYVNGTLDESLKKINYYENRKQFIKEYDLVRYE